MARTNTNSGGGGGGVTSLNALTGAVTLSAGEGIFLTEDGNDIEISTIGTGTGDFVLEVKVATTAVLPGSPVYNNGVGGVGATLTRSSNGTTGAIDGVAVGNIMAGDRILVKNQAAQLQNGIYEVTQQGVAGVSPYILTRTSDADETAEMDDMAVVASLGSTNRGITYGQQTNNPTIGTNNIVFTASGIFLRQQTSGTQTAGNIPYYISTAQTLTKGDTLFYRNPTTKYSKIGVDLGSISTGWSTATDVGQVFGTVYGSGIYSVNTTAQEIISGTTLLATTGDLISGGFNYNSLSSATSAQVQVGRNDSTGLFSRITFNDTGSGVAGGLRIRNTDMQLNYTGELSQEVDSISVYNYAKTKRTITVDTDTNDVLLGDIDNDTNNVILTVNNTNGTIDVSNSIIRGDDLHNNALAQGSATQQDVRSGTYTPTLTGINNIDSTTAYECQWMRVGNVVTVSGKLGIDPTANNTSTRVRISLPIASNFATEQQCGGTGSNVDTTITAHSARVVADTTNNEAEFGYYETHGTASEDMTFHFTYVVI